MFAYLAVPLFIKDESPRLFEVTHSILNTILSFNATDGVFPDNVLTSYHLSQYKLKGHFPAKLFLFTAGRRVQKQIPLYLLTCQKPCFWLADESLYELLQTEFVPTKSLKKAVDYIF